MKVIKLEKGKKEDGCVEPGKVGETWAGKALRAAPSAPFVPNQEADILFVVKGDICIC
ncbi:MAG: hypothetical protein HY266_08290 [Deltaproteobacteria bacterium]|nr:hypothetical protein [Deltaproteobacteria bacterium]